MPRYETRMDVQNESAIAKQVASRWGIKIQKNAPRAPIDYMILGDDNRLLAWMEIKHRERVSSSSYDSLWVDFEKYRQCIDHARISGAPFLLVYRLADGIHYWKYQPQTASKIETQTQGYVSLGGRRDRNDPSDIKAVMNIPISEWKKII